MNSTKALKILNENLQAAIHDCDGLNPEYEQEQVEALQMAIKALEKQIPKKPKRINKNSVFDGDWKMICPCCSVTLMERITTEDKSYPVHYNVTKHCWCGQVLDWSEVM